MQIVNIINKVLFELRSNKFLLHNVSVDIDKHQCLTSYSPSDYFVNKQHFFARYLSIWGSNQNCGLIFRRNWLLKQSGCLHLLPLLPRYQLHQNANERSRWDETHSSNQCLWTIRGSPHSHLKGQSYLARRLVTEAAAFVEGKLKGKQVSLCNAEWREFVRSSQNQPNGIKKFSQGGLGPTPTSHLKKDKVQFLARAAFRSLLYLPFCSI